MSLALVSCSDGSNDNTVGLPAVGGSPSADEVPVSEAGATYKSATNAFDDTQTITVKMTSATADFGDIGKKYVMFTGSMLFFKYAELTKQ